MNTFSPDFIPAPIKTPKLHAVLIGIDWYLAGSIRKLDGAVADAKAMESYLKDHLTVPKSQITTLHNDQATREAIIQAIKDLRSDEKGDPFLIYFAGHGAEGKRSTDSRPSDPTTQMIIPYDFEEPDDDSTVQGILDCEFNELLEKLATTQGDNITVILDCCHSGSGTRDTPSVTNNGKVRSIKLEKIIPSIRKGARGSKIAKGFSHAGLRSHILLAACSENGEAREFNGRGEFTRRLIEVLIATGGRVTYHHLLKLLDIPGQFPQCEGLYKTRFLWNSMGLDLPYFNVRCENGSYILDAGTAHGITQKTQFTIYQEINDYPSKPRGVLVVQEAHLTTSTLAPLGSSGTARIPETWPLLKKYAFAFLRKVGEEGEFLLHIEDKDLRESFERLEEVQKASLPHHHHPWEITLKSKKKANLALGIKHEYITFEVLNPSVADFGLHYMPFRVKQDQITSIIQCAAHFHWHLRRAISQPIFQESVRLEFAKIYKQNGSLQVDKSNLNVNNRIDIGVGEDKYGIKLINNSDDDIYPYLFYFDCSDLSIDCYYDSPTARASGTNAPLRAGGTLTIGYSATGWSPWSYSLRQPTPIENGLIMQDGQDVDVGFLKLFLSGGPLDLSHMVQESPFKSHSKAGYRGGKRDAHDVIDHCETRTIALVQRKEPVKDKGDLKPDQGGSKPRSFWPKWVQR